MQSSTKALRAISYTLFRRVLLPISWLIAGCIIIFVIIVALLAVMVDYSWLWLYVLILPLSLAVLLALALIWALAAKVSPRKLTSTERSTITRFVDKIMQITEIRTTPWPVIAALIGKDLLRGKRSSYVDNLIASSRTLKDDFVTIKALFD